MTNAEMSTLVLKDHAGNYFLVPQATLERGRVPDEQKGEIDRLIAEHQDVQGHWLHFLVPAAVITTGIVLVVREINQQNTVEPLPLPSQSSIPTGAPETIRTGAGPLPI